MFANPDRRSVAFMRSYPNHLPLSARVTARVPRALEEFDFDRLYGNFAIRIDADARAIVRRSADRHIRWVRGTSTTSRDRCALPATSSAQRDTRLARLDDITRNRGSLIVDRSNADRSPYDGCGSTRRGGVRDR